MQDGGTDETVEKSLIRKWRFLIRECEPVKPGKYSHFKFDRDFNPLQGCLENLRHRNSLLIETH